MNHALLPSAISALCLVGFSPLHAARVYYVNQPEGGFGRINSVQPDGTGHTTLHTTSVVTDLRGIAVDPLGHRLFYSHADFDPTTPARTQVSLRVIGTAGGAPSAIATFPDGTFISDVEWDAVNGWIYFAQSGQIRRMRPDGTGMVTVLTPPAGQGAYFFGLDLIANLAYWGIGTEKDDTNTAYSRGSLATGVVDPDFALVTPSRTRDIAVDHRLPAAWLYWCDRQNGAVYQQLAEGGPRSIACFGLNAPHGLALDLEAGKGYVADTGKRGSGSQPSSHSVVRFNLDGTGSLEWLSPFANGRPVDETAEPWDVAIDTTSSSYTDWKSRFFSADATDSSPADDGDGDGRANFFEYAFFSHPARTDTHQHTTSASGRGFRFARRLVSDVSYRVEVSADLQTWHWNGDTAGALWTAETATALRDSESDWVTVSAVGAFTNRPKLFFRLRATNVP